jgi:hypothetical protein
MTTTKRYTEAETADLIAQFAEQAQNTATPARRTRIVEAMMPTAPVTGYRVAVAGIPVADVKARGFGEAVCIAHDGLPEIRGYLFMWDYTVTDSEGMTLRGSDPVLRTAVQDARIARQNRR